MEQREAILQALSGLVSVKAISCIASIIIVKIALVDGLAEGRWLLDNECYKLA